MTRKSRCDILCLNMPTLALKNSHQAAEPKNTPITNFKESIWPLVSIVSPVKSAMKSKIVAGLVSVRKKVDTNALSKSVVAICRISFGGAEKNFLMPK